MSHARYPLKSPAIFKWAMENPGSGIPYSVRKLAAASRCDAGTIQKLRDGKQQTVSVPDAHALAEALDYPLLGLFAPPVTPNRVTSTTDQEKE